MQQHYDNFLAKYYSWMFGDYNLKVKENKDFFQRKSVIPCLSGQAIDLGCGSGFQSLALADLGFQVLSLDISAALLSELKRRAGNRNIKAVHDDIVNFQDYLNSNKAEAIVCMGDTLTHLESFEKVVILIDKAYKSIEQSGKLILSFRDMTEELIGLDRIIPVHCDENVILTCFLEYRRDYVIVNDCIYNKVNLSWDLTKSCYKKLRIGAEWAEDKLREIGFQISFKCAVKGFVTIVAFKP